MKKNLRHWVFLLCLVLFFTMFDAGIAYYGEEVWPFSANDYEATRYAHREEVWDRVFFGNSSVISAYRENLSKAGYVNLGLDYGVVTDLWEMLNEGYIDIGSDLVIGLNLFTLYDDFATNPAYIWHRGALEPYVYFHRDKLLRICREFDRLKAPDNGTNFAKILYYGAMTDEEITGKVATYEENYFNLPQSDFQENIEALDKIADWCEENGVRLRILWMPFHPDVERPQRMLELQDAVNGWCVARNITVEDYTDKMDKSCFHDVGHLNDEIGAVKFTEVIDPWLLS